MATQVKKMIEETVTPTDLTPVKPTDAESKKLAAKEKMEYEKAKDAQLVKGMFKYYETPGGLLQFVYKKYHGEDVKLYEMQDNMVYTIPLGVAKHINNDMWHPIHAYVMDQNGKPIQQATKKVKRAGFQSLEFMDIEDFDRGGQQIIKLENMAIPS